MSTNKRQITAAFDVIKGATWAFDVPRFAVGGVEVSAPQMASAVVTGSIGGVAITSFASDPAPGVRLRVICAPSVTALAVPADTPYPSDIRVSFSPTEVHKIRMLITVLSSPTT